MSRSALIFGDSTKNIQSSVQHVYKADLGGWVSVTSTLSPREAPLHGIQNSRDMNRQASSDPTYLWDSR